ncbi:MAG: phosphoribosylformylglycinamidine synthase subunit PurS [Rhodobacteraceae bacterium]|jgi:phosphoribosylformylglycinamidine synthase subunit PurS|nr:phosphoribosylformylglycinamidine synthase subunit PurS [Paracoccaceae bacterium]
MKVRVHVMPKDGLLDPQGEAINIALINMGFAEVKKVRQGKVIELELEEADKIVIKNRVEDMCQKLLANSVIESFHVEDI